MSPASPILELASVRWDAEPPLDLRIAAGECVVLRLGADEGRRARALGNAVGGIEPPPEGAVRFMGADWRTLPPAAAERRRARIGRVFEGAAWVSNLDVDENVLLSQRHHTRRPEAELRAEAERLARAFGLARLPVARAAWAAPRDLQRAQWVRALLGAPALLALEFPERHAAAGDLAAFAAAVDEARARGAGVLWITARPAASPPLSTAAGAVGEIVWTSEARE